MERRSLIRLVTQFDRPTVRVSVATPTCCCAGCSSCCCCIVTLSTTAIYTAVHAQRTLHRTAREAPERISSTAPVPGLLGFFALPIAGIGVFLVLALSNSAAAGWFVFFATWFGVVTLALHIAGSRSPWKRAALIVVLTSVAFVVELFLFAAVSGNA